jgi:hypothetical protein
MVSWSHYAKPSRSGGCGDEKPPRPSKTRLPTFFYPSTLPHFLLLVNFFLFDGLMVSGIGK